MTPTPTTRCRIPNNRRGRSLARTLTLEPLADRIVPAMDPFQEPPILAAVDGVLDVTLTQAVGEAMIGDTPASNVWMYNDQFAPPILQVNPGDTLNVNIVNELEQPTNLHPHGVNTSPLGNGDNVLLNIAPGETFTQSFDIPSFHPEGTYWYHPHRHGFVNDQIGHGLSGMLLIGRGDGGIRELDGLVQNHLILKNTWVVDGEVMIPQDGENHDDQIFTVNGQVNPVLTMKAGEWRVFRSSTRRRTSTPTRKPRTKPVAVPHPRPSASPLHRWRWSTAATVVRPRPRRCTRSWPS
ncbi:Blue copper oxidase CueO precursor [Planctomycetes bacterium Pan216]|uniref:Blue copper oxidase CueO n=1 Tax=Kolteria novifilia TaxID=2527975 RepID=A0A518B472_9BACT|nr:Blue copper oxidase CueO precursor [Planctomycetes bacterium Pan216]